MTCLKSISHDRHREGNAEEMRRIPTDRNGKTIRSNDTLSGRNGTAMRSEPFAQSQFHHFRRNRNQAEWMTGRIEEHPPVPGKLHRSQLRTATLGETAFFLQFLRRAHIKIQMGHLLLSSGLRRPYRRLISGDLLKHQRRILPGRIIDDHPAVFGGLRTLLSHPRNSA